MNFGPIGLSEILVILVVVVLLFGVKNLPGLARRAGKTTAQARKELRDLKDDIDLTK